MGGFYANVVVETAEVDRVLGAVRTNGLPAAVATDGRFVVVADERLDLQDEDWLHSLTEQISASTGKPALGALVHDDSVLLLSLAAPGAPAHRYHSRPAYFDDAMSETPVGGDAEVFAAAFPSASIGGLDHILNAGDEDDAYLFASDRHRAIAQALALPSWSVWFSYEGLERYPPEGFDRSFLRRFGSP